jgi:hypothetical protein
MGLTFRKYGGSIQVKTDAFSELMQAVLLPETQWVAVSVPTSALVADARFLGLLDEDQNGRVRVDELQAAVAWTAARLSNTSGADKGSDTLQLDHIKDDGIKAAAGAVLDALKASDKTKVTVAEVKDAVKPLREAGMNGDGIVAERHLDEKLRPVAEQIRKLFPETKNRGDEPGLAPATLTAFVDERTKLLAKRDEQQALFVWGDASLEHAKRIAAMRARLDEHFLLCRLVASQPDARERFRLAPAQIEALVGDRSALEKALASLPVAPPDPAGVIAWSTLHRGPSFEDLTAFAKDIAGPLTKDSERLTESAWRELCAKADAILAWEKELAASPLAGILDALKGFDMAAVDAIKAAQDKDLAQADKLKAIDDLERLALYQQWLVRFANSFIAMPDLYSDKKRALFERGHAIFAGRRYQLSVAVPDVGAHKAHTEQGTTCVVYANVKSKDGGVAFDVAIPKTRGWSTELAVGKRGIFYDVDNVEYDALITHIVRHPVSVIEAALSPFVRLGETINKKLASLADDSDAVLAKHSSAATAKIDGVKAAAVTTVTTTPGAAAAPAKEEPKPAAAAPPAAPPMGNALAAGGLAVAAVGSSLAFVAAQLKALSLTDVLSIIAIVFVAVALPSGFVGWLKLRRRNLAQLLEGAGWALNDRLGMTASLAALITRKPARPADSSLELITFAKTTDEDESTGKGGLILLAIVATVVFIAWQVKDPILKAGCHESRIPAGVCAAFDIAPGVDHEPSP